MSNLFNPYALTALGKPLQQRQAPELRVETPYVTRAQLDMAQHTFVRFLDQARLSKVPNPTEQGRLADGTPYRIVTASGAPIMQVWPVEVSQKDLENKLKHGIVVLAGMNFAVIYFDERYQWVVRDVAKGVCGQLCPPYSGAGDGNVTLFRSNHSDPTGFSNTDGWITHKDNSLGGVYLFDEWVNFEHYATGFQYSRDTAIVVEVDTHKSLLNLYEVRNTVISKGGGSGDTENYKTLELLRSIPVIHVYLIEHPFGMRVSSNGQIITYGTSEGLVNQVVTGLPSIIGDYTTYYIEAPATRKQVIDIRYGEGDTVEINKAVTTINNGMEIFKFAVEIDAGGYQSRKKDRPITATHTAVFKDYEDGYHGSDSGCSGISNYYSDISGASATASGEVGYLFEEYYDYYITARAFVKKEGVHICSYYDFKGDIKDVSLDVDVERTTSYVNRGTYVNVSSGLDSYSVDRKFWERYPRPFVDSLNLSPSDYVVNEYVEDFTRDGSPQDRLRDDIKEYNATMVHKISLRIGGGSIPLIWGDGVKVKLLYSSRGKSNFGEINKALVNMEANTTTITAVNYLSDVIAGVQCEIVGKDIDAEYLGVRMQSDVLEATLAVKLTATVYWRGRLVYSKPLLKKSMKLRFFVVKNLNDVMDLLTTERTTGEYIECSFEKIHVQDTSSGGRCPVRHYGLGSTTRTHRCLTREFEKTESYGPGITEKFTYLDIGMENYNILFDSEVTGIINGFTKRHNTATDPVSGGCVVTGPACNVLVSPHGRVDELGGLVPEYDSKVDYWCAST